MLRNKILAISPDVTVVSEESVAGATKEKIANQTLKSNDLALIDVRGLGLMDVQIWKCLQLTDWEVIKVLSLSGFLPILHLVFDTSTVNIVKRKVKERKKERKL